MMESAASSSFNNDPLPATAVAVLISRSTGGKNGSANAGTARLAVAARIPRKRQHSEDPVQSTLQHWSFLDDKRLFTHLDSLLTRLAPIRIVHVACTESSAPSSDNQVRL